MQQVKRTVKASTASFYRYRLSALERLPQPFGMILQAFGSASHHRSIRLFTRVLKELTGKPVKLSDLLDYSDEANQLGPFYYLSTKLFTEHGVRPQHLNLGMPFYIFTGVKGSASWDLVEAVKPVEVAKKALADYRSFLKNQTDAVVTMVEAESIERAREKLALNPTANQLVSIFTSNEKPRSFEPGLVVTIVKSFTPNPEVGAGLFTELIHL